MNSSLVRSRSISETVAPFEQRAGRAGHDALAARGAGVRVAPGLVEVGDDPGFGAAAGDILGAGALDVPAHPHAAGAEDAAVMVHAEKRVGVVHLPLGEIVLVADVVHALAAGEGLEFAMAVGDAHRADMVALGEQQFSVIRRYLRRRSLSVLMSMPSATLVVQAGSSLAMPATSTRQSRQAPTS